MIRPQLFSFLFFAGFHYILHLYFFKGKDRLFLLPLIMALWVNMHGGFLMGWALVMGATGWKTIERLILRRSVPELGRLWIWLLAVSLATLANPYGYGLLQFLHYTLSFPRAITEWAPVYLWDLSDFRFKLMGALFLVMLAIHIRRVEGWEAAAVGALLFAAFRHQRHTPFFAMAAAPFLVHWLSVAGLSVKERFPRIALGRTAEIVLASALLLFSAHQLYQGVNIYIAARGSIIVNTSEYPVGAVRFLKENKAQGNLLLTFDWGQYAIWHLYPDCRVSIDGRFRTVYPERVIQNHFIHKEDGAGWKQLMNQYPADILLARQSRFFDDLIQRADEWVYVYSDPIAIIFIRDSKRNRSFLERFQRKELIRPDAATSIYFP